MKFGIHNPSFVFGPDPAEAFEGLKAKAQWAESHGFTWFSVMDHLIQIPPVGAGGRAFYRRLDGIVGTGRGDQSHPPCHARLLGRLPQSRRTWPRSPPASISSAAAA